MTEQNSRFAHALPPCVNELVNIWVQEDVPGFDIGGYVVGEKEETAHLYCKSLGVIAGIPFAQAVFDKFGLEVEWKCDEGTLIEPQPKFVCAIVRGKCRNILMAERISLNILARASGVASRAKRVVDIAKDWGWHGYVAGTRKTTPGFRAVEKYALVVAGAATHRQDLLIADGHVKRQSYMERRKYYQSCSKGENIFWVLNEDRSE